MPRQRKPLSVLRLLVLAAWMLAIGCHGAKKQTEEDTDTSPQDSTTLEIEKDRLLSEDKAFLCEAFRSIAQNALAYHLEHKQGSLNSLLHQSLQIDLEKIIKDTENEELRSRLQTLKGKYDAPFSNCAPYEELSEMLASPRNAAFLPYLNSTFNSNVKDLTGLQTDPWWVRLKIIYWSSLTTFVDRLDIYSSYFSPIDLRLLTSQKELKSAGLFFKYRTDYDLGRKPEYLIVKGWYRISNPSDLKRGTRVYAINGKAISSFDSFRDAVSAMNYVESDTLSLSYCEPNDDCYKNPKDPNVLKREKEVQLTDFRERVVFCHELSDHQHSSISYIRVADFSVNLASKNFNLQFETCSDDKDGVILDLRGNPGGGADEAQHILERFLDDEVPVFQIARVVKESNDSTITINGKPATTRTVETFLEADPIESRAIVVLTDRFTASAAEIVVAGLKENDRALVLGETTTGKGLGQRLLPQHHSELKGFLLVSNFYWFTASGTNVHLTGIRPHIKQPDPVLDDWCEEKNRGRKTTGVSLFKRKGREEYARTHQATDDRWPSV